MGMLLLLSLVVIIVLVVAVVVVDVVVVVIGRAEDVVTVLDAARLGMAVVLEE